MLRWSALVAVIALSTPASAAPIARAFTLSPPPARIAPTTKPVPKLADYLSATGARGHIRPEQIKILEELIRHTPASEFEELNDYRFRLADLLEWVSQQDPADRAKEAQAGAAFAALVADPMYDRYPKADQGLWLYVQHLTRVGKSADASQVAQLLLKQYPASQYVAEMHAQLGDEEFDRGKFDDAAKLYAQVLAFPRARSLWYARYKLGLAYSHRRREADAYHAFAPVAVGPDRVLQELALAEAARSFVLHGTVDQAAAATDRYDVGRTVGLLRAVGAEYLARGRYREADFVYGELATKHGGNAVLACIDRANALRAAARSGLDVRAPMSALEAALPTAGVPCADAAELAMFDTAYALHTAGVGTTDRLLAAIGLWDRAAAATPADRRAGITRNRTIALWHVAEASGDAARWATAAEALHASGADLAEAALDAWENAMRAGGAGMPPALVSRIRAGLDKIPADRARVLRSGLR